MTDAQFDKMVKLLSKNDMTKTDVFVRQIEKLSSRLDEAHSANAQLLNLLARQQASYDRLQASYERLYNLMETQLSHLNIINNTSNN